MMYVAIDSNKDRIQIENASSNTEYFCPICGERLIIKAIDSKSIRKHFAHKSKKDCDDFSHDMSDWHYNWQCCFPEETREIVLENNGVKHRADILINDTIIEFQHCPITADEIKKRNEFYLSCGYNMVWVFDADGKIKNDYGNSNSINPLECGTNDLVWKRERSQFYDPMPNNVIVFLDYKINIKTKDKEYNNIDNLIMLKNVDRKFIDFYETKPNLIFHSNFIKQFGVNIDNVLSISDILSINKEYHRKQNEARTKQTPIILLNRNKGRHWRF